MADDLVDCEFTLEAKPESDSFSAEPIGVFSSSELYNYLETHNITDVEGNDRVRVSAEYECRYTPRDPNYVSVVSKPSVGNLTTGIGAPPETATAALVRMSAIWTNDTISYKVLDPTFLANMTAKVATCELQFCAKSYSSVTVHNNVITVGDMTNMDLIATDLTINAGPNTTYEVFNTTTGSTYSVNAQDRIKMWGYLMSLLRVQQKRSFDSSDYSTYAMDARLSEYLATSDLNEVLGRVAGALTSIVRSNDNMNLTTLEGDSYEPVLFTKVRWAWLACPVAIVVLATCLLIVSMVQSSSKPLLLKSSPLAYLFHGLDGWSKNELELTSRRAGMRETPQQLCKIAEGMNARLKRNADGEYKFAKVD